VDLCNKLLHSRPKHAEMCVPAIVQAALAPTRNEIAPRYPVRDHLAFVQRLLHDCKVKRP
jgi:hypothetical protein